MKKSTKEYIMPPVVLVAICLVMTAILAITYQLTLPKIEATRIATANAARAAVQPEADRFELCETETNIEGIDEVYYAMSGDERIGCVVTATVRGFGGDYTVMSGYGLGGELSGVKVMSHSETPGLGSKTTVEAYTSNYIGKTVDNYSSVDAVTGATISSKALKSALAISFDAQKTVMGVTE